MRPPKLPAGRALAGIAFFTALAAALPLTAFAAAAHVVISEFATRGPTAATDEFVELYNPTENAVDLSGWKMQYKATASTIWNDRVVLPANSLDPRARLLPARQPVVRRHGDARLHLVSVELGNGHGGQRPRAHPRCVRGRGRQGGLGHRDRPRGRRARPRTTGRPRTATASSARRSPPRRPTRWPRAGCTSSSGNGQDTDVNGNDFVTQTHGRNPQNSSQPARTLVRERAATAPAARSHRPRSCSRAGRSTRCTSRFARIPATR